MRASACRPWWKRKRWWVAVALWLVLAYPLSYGPAYWLPWRYSSWRGPAAEATDSLYAPLRWFHVNGPEWLVGAFNWYVDLWSPFDGPPGAI